jgi:hypothetical protein
VVWIRSLELTYKDPYSASTPYACRPRIQIPAAETKTKTAIELPWPELLMPPLQACLSDHRAAVTTLDNAVPGTAGDVLWLSVLGTPIRRRAREIGIPWRRGHRDPKREHSAS